MNRVGPGHVITINVEGLPCHREHYREYHREYSWRCSRGRRGGELVERVGRSR